METFGPRMDLTWMRRFSPLLSGEHVITHLRKYSGKWATTYRQKLVRFWPNAGEPSFKGEGRPDLKQFCCALGIGMEVSLSSASVTIFIFIYL